MIIASHPDPEAQLKKAGSFRLCLFCLFLLVIIDSKIESLLRICRCYT